MKSLVVLALLCSLLTANCGTLKVSKYTARPFEKYEHSQINSQVGIAIHPLFSEDEQISYFGKNLSEEQVLAIFLLVENRSRDSSYLVASDQIMSSISSENANPDKSFSDKSVSSTAHAAGALMMGGVVLLSPIAIAASMPLLLTESKKMTDNSIVKHSMAENALKRNTLSPGESLKGFVYFQLPENNKKDFMQMDILINLIQLGKNSDLKFKFTLELPH